MDNETTINYARFTLEGSHYDIGHAMGKNLALFPAIGKYMILSEGIDENAMAEKRKLIDEFCPGIFDEVSGLADALDVPVARIMTMSENCICSGACSQFVAMPSITGNGHILAGRSYEYSTDDEFCLCVIRADGKPAHIGFSLFLFGRFDGINQHGLAVSMSSCEFGQRPEGSGFWFPLVLRSLLDNCRNVDEGVYLLKKIPIRSNINIMLADKNGNAVIAETASLAGEKKVSFRKNDEYLIATNHYMNDDMLKYDNHRGRHSVLRYKIIQEALLKNKESVSINTIKKILERKIPEGVFCPYYSDGLGTLHSMVFDVSETEVEVSLGMPSQDKWERIRFDAPFDISNKNEIIRNEFPEDPGKFWTGLPPGSMTI